MFRWVCVIWGLVCYVGMAPFSLAFEVKTADRGSFPDKTGTVLQLAQLMPEINDRHVGGMSKEKALSRAIVNVPRNSFGPEKIVFPDKDFVFDLPIMIPLQEPKVKAPQLTEHIYPNNKYYWLQGLFPSSWKRNQVRSSVRDTRHREFRSPVLALRSSKPERISHPDILNSLGTFPTSPQSGYSHLSIVVNHKKHTLRLLAHPLFGNAEVLFHCRVGLGSGEFPTPPGVYFVTHIYDDDPWWIPPKNRAWALGQRPSRTVYGGIMAPLLKKRFVRSKQGRRYRRHKKRIFDDYIAGKVQLNDYDYRFHGTNQPRSIGRNQSHGCVRMLPKDAKALADLIKQYVGTDARNESENGTFVVLKAPVRLTIIKE